MAYVFNHLHLKAPDPEKTANWYVKAFGFKIMDDSVRDLGDRFIRCQTAEGIGVNISGARPNETLGDGDASVHWGLEHFAMNVDDLDAEIQRLKELGAELLEGPSDRPSGMRTAFVKVPDDVRVELLQPPR